MHGVNEAPDALVDVVRSGDGRLDVYRYETIASRDIRRSQVPEAPCRGGEG
jgi:hypothetical protein